MKQEVDTDISSLLGKLQRIDAPPFLLTRIKEKIKTEPEIKVGMGWVLAGGMSLIMMLIMNVAIINRDSVKHPKTQNLIESMNLAPENTLYQ